MPRYQFDLEADVATATALVQLCMESATKFSFHMVEPDKVQILTLPAKPRKHNYVSGTSTYAEIWKLCHQSTNNTATHVRILQVFERLGYAARSADAAISLLVLTGLFERHKGGIRMLNDKTTLEQIAALIMQRRREWKEKQA